MYKSLLAKWYGICDEFKRRGFRYLFVMIPEDPKLMKFEQMFGFQPIQALHSEQDPSKVARVIMRKEL
jgi:hypothetical protein